MKKKSDRPPAESTTIRLDSESLKTVKELAVAEHRTVSSLINHAVWEYLDRRASRSSTSHPLSTPTTTFKKMRQGQRLADLEQTAKDLLATIQALRDEDST